MEKENANSNVDAIVLECVKKKKLDKVEEMEKKSIKSALGLLQSIGNVACKEGEFAFALLAGEKLSRIIAEYEKTRLSLDFVADTSLPTKIESGDVDKWRVKGLLIKMEALNKLNKQPEDVLKLRDEAMQTLRACNKDDAFKKAATLKLCFFCRASNDVHVKLLALEIINNVYPKIYTEDEKQVNDWSNYIGRLLILFFQNNNNKSDASILSVFDKTFEIMSAEVKSKSEVFLKAKFFYGKVAFDQLRLEKGLRGMRDAIHADNQLLEVCALCLKWQQHESVLDVCEEWVYKLSAQSQTTLGALFKYYWIACMSRRRPEEDTLVPFLTQRRVDADEFEELLRLEIETFLSLFSKPKSNMEVLRKSLDSLRCSSQGPRREAVTLAMLQLGVWDGSANELVGSTNRLIGAFHFIKFGGDFESARLNAEQACSSEGGRLDELLEISAWYELMGWPDLGEKILTPLAAEEKAKQRLHHAHIRNKRECVVPALLDKSEVQSQLSAFAAHRSLYPMQNHLAFCDTLNEFAEMFLRRGDGRVGKYFYKKAAELCRSNHFLGMQALFEWRLGVVSAGLEETTVPGEDEHTKYWDVARDLRVLEDAEVTFTRKQSGAQRLDFAEEEDVLVRLASAEWSQELRVRRNLVRALDWFRKERRVEARKVCAEEVARVDVLLWRVRAALRGLELGDDLCLTDVAQLTWLAVRDSRSCSLVDLKRLCAYGAKSLIADDARVSNEDDVAFFIHSAVRAQVPTFASGVEQKRRLDECMDASHTVVSLCYLEGDAEDTVLVARSSAGAVSQCAWFPVREAGRRVLREFAELIECSERMTSQPAKVSKKAWWEEREQMDARLQHCLDGVEAHVLGWRRVLLLGGVHLTRDEQNALDAFVRTHRAVIQNVPLFNLVCKNACALDQRETAAALTHSCGGREVDESLVRFVVGFSGGLRDRKRLPVALALGRKLQSIAFESMPMFDKHPVTRVLSLDEAIAHSVRWGGGVLSIKSVSCLIDPKDNLPSTRKTMEEELGRKKKFEMEIGKPPANFKATLLKHDLFIYCGHGAGEEFLSRDDLLEIKPEEGSVAISLLFGCSSGKRKEHGVVYEPNGIIDAYALQAPLVLGNLWDVTDKDIDRFTLGVINGGGGDEKFAGICGGEEVYLSEVVSCARKECKLKYLIGGAPVVYVRK